jgi:hypothetical protein
MNRNSANMKKLSLAGHFDAPDGYTGCFGWLCGYSADVLFLVDAATRFTRLTSSQRAHQGRVALAVMLDPGNQPICIQDAPGVAHLPIKANVKKPFRLLHAKVALLGYQHQENRGQWQLRLLVSTGNWTRQTLEESLDLVWRIDFASDSLSDPDTIIKQECSDIKAAWGLLTWIQNLFDTRLLNAAVNGRLSETMNAHQQVQQWINACSRKAEGQPRVFDNRSKPLIAQLSDKININGKLKRNYLAMGSGFYEAPADHGKPPEVPVAIIDYLQKNGFLTAKPWVDLYVNPMACQAIATAVKPLQARGVTIRPAAVPQIVFGEGVQRNLHAKFLFSANSRDNSNNCASAWVYLGSGNLTHPGFFHKMSASAGNLEVGVVFFPNSLCWQKSQDHPVVTNLLPIQWDDEIGDATHLSAGLDMEQRDTIFISPPVAWLTWHEVDSGHELRTSEPSAIDIQVLDSAGFACPKTDTGYRWSEAQPRQVRIRWQTNDQAIEALIPVVDQYGRLAATDLPAIDIVEAWWQLADFPLPPNEDVDIENNGNEDKGKWTRSPVPAANYPIRQMMELVENIAAKQTEINEMDWEIWCNCLEQILGQARDSTPVRCFRDELKLNPLSPLRHQSFRPSFAETCESGHGKRYEEALEKIAIIWKVSELSPIGGE